MSNRSAWAIGLLAGGFIAAYGTVIARLARFWAGDDTYSHAFVILPVAVYLVWQRRNRLRAVTPGRSLAGLAVLVASLLLLVLGTLGAEVFVTRISLPAAIAGAILFVGGRRALSTVAFPLALMLLVIPLPTILFAQVTFPLQLVASRLGEFALWVTGIPVLREGNVITLAHVRLEVAEACSGIRSLMSLVALAALYGYFCDTRLWVRATLTALAVPVAIVVNGLRIAATGILAQAWGLDAAEGFFHSFSGWLMFIAAFGLLAGIHRVLVAWRPRPFRLPAPLQTES